MKRTLVGLAAVASALVVASGATVMAQATDPASVMDAYTAAINAHDVEAALAFVADDAVYQRPGGEFTGADQIRGFIEGLIEREVVVELIGERTVDGERVTWRSQVTLQNPPQEISNNSESIVRDGKIVMHGAQRAE